MSAPGDEIRATWSRLACVADDARWQAVEKAVELVGHYGRVMNLTSDLSQAGLWSQVEEAIACVDALSQVGGLDSSWLDVGSGGGFPGLVFAALSAGSGRLVEPRQKRREFLSLALPMMGCSSRVRVFRGRLSARGWIEADRDLVAGSPDTWVSARAVFPVRTWEALAPQLVAPGGLMLVHADRGYQAGLPWAELARSEDRNGNSGIVCRLSACAVD